MELCYMVSISVLEEILQSEAKPDTIYTLLANEDTVTVVHFGPSGLINQFAFPLSFAFRTCLKMKAHDAAGGHGTKPRMAELLGAAGNQTASLLLAEHGRLKGRLPRPGR